jgi:hypothetical protein
LITPADISVVFFLQILLYLPGHGQARSDIDRVHNPPPKYCCDLKRFGLQARRRTVCEKTDRFIYPNKTSPKTDCLLAGFLDGR